MKHLSIEEYNILENMAKKSCPYMAIREFSPHHFNLHNFPTYVETEEEISKFADIMYEFEPREKMYDTLINQDELQMIKTLEESYRFASNIRPFLGFVANIPIFRVIQAINGKVGKNCRILEIGAGSGFLGSMCIYKGFNYASTDVTQSLYLWQNRIFSNLADEEFEEILGEDFKISKRVSHFPWWHLIRLHEYNPKFDIIICDRALGEMTMFCQRYLIKTSKKMLNKSGLPAFVYQTVGWHQFGNENSLLGDFQREGYHHLMLNNCHVYTIENKQNNLREVSIENGGIKPSSFLKYKRDEVSTSHLWVDESLEWNKISINRFIE